MKAEITSRDPKKPWMAGEKWGLDRRRAAGLAAPEGYDPLVVPILSKPDWLSEESGTESGWGWLYDEAKRLHPETRALESTSHRDRRWRELLAEPSEAVEGRGFPTEDWLR